MGIVLDEVFERAELGIQAPKRANGVNGAARHAGPVEDEEPEPKPAPLSVEHAQDVLSMCAAACADAAEKVSAIERELSERETARSVALDVVRGAEHAFDADETHEAATRLATVQQELSAAELLCRKTTDRLEQARERVAMATEAKQCAERDLTIAQLRAALDAPFSDALVEAENSIRVAERMRAMARARFEAELANVFARLAADAQTVAELGTHGVRVRETSPLYAVSGVLSDMAGDGRLVVASEPRIGPDAHGRNHWTWHHGPHASALVSLRPLADALGKRDPVAVLVELEKLTGEADERTRAVASKLAEVLQANRDDLAIMQAVARADEPARLEYEPRRAAQEEEERRQAEARGAYAIAISEAARRRGAPHRLL